MPTQRYSMSFTTGALLYRESVIVAELYAELGDWTSVRSRVLADNSLQMRTPNSSERICSEVTSRLKQLTQEELAFVTNGSRHEQGYVLWLASCKRYRLLHDFAVEIIREKYLRLDLNLTNADYDAFYHAKADWHPELAAVASKTFRNQRNFLYQALRDADLLTTDGRILPALLTPTLARAIRDDDPAHFAIFPVSELDVKQWTQ